MSLKFTDGSEQVTFSGGTTTITVNPADNQTEMLIQNRAQIALLVDYTQGDEGSVQIAVEFSPDVDLTGVPGVPAVPATGTDYYGYSDIAGSGSVTVLAFSFAATGKYRVPIPILHQERMIRLGVGRTQGSDGGAGTVALRIVDDAHFVTSPHTRRQP